MNLSPHFTLEELTRSDTARKLGLDNTPESFLIPNLSKTAYGMEEVRTLLGDKPILISSGYRSHKVNLAVGSKNPNSQHTIGCAVDFTCPQFGDPEAIVRKIVDSEINFDQVIQEHKSWVHISFSDRNRKQALVIDGAGTRSFA